MSNIVTTSGAEVGPTMVREAENGRTSGTFTVTPGDPEAANPDAEIVLTYDEE